MGGFQGLDICEIVQFHPISFSKRVEKNNLEKSHKGKRHIFSSSFYKIYLIFFKIKVFFR